MLGRPVRQFLAKLENRDGDLGRAAALDGLGVKALNFARVVAHRESLRAAGGGSAFGSKGVDGSLGQLVERAIPRVQDRRADRLGEER